MVAAFKSNWRLYVMEAAGLAIFMVSACIFSAMLFAPGNAWYHFFSNDIERNVIMGIAMGLTALLIFYSPFTAPSGAHINPAVTITFCRLGKIGKTDTFFYILFQCIGGTIAVLLMQWLMGNTLTAPPVNSAVTVPGKYGVWAAALTEFFIAAITMTIVLGTSASIKLKKYTRKIMACMVCCYVVAAGPISGFGMNPARSLASAIPSGIYTSFWIYLLMPFAGMLGVAECFITVQSAKDKRKLPVRSKNIKI